MQIQSSGESNNNIKEDSKTERKLLKKNKKTKALKIQKTNKSVKKRMGRAKEKLKS